MIYRQRVVQDYSSERQLPFSRYREGGRQPLGPPKPKSGNCRHCYGKAVMRECGTACVYCDRDLAEPYESWLDVSVDHVIPTETIKRLGYPSEWVNDLINLVTCCRACNDFLNGHRVQAPPPATWVEFLEIRDQAFEEKRRHARGRHQQERKMHREWLATGASGEREHISKILVPSVGAEDWRRLLADPMKHWRTGNSAKTLASCWEATDDFPASVKAVFNRSPFEELHGLEMLIGIPERRVPLPGGRRASQTDLFVLAQASDRLVAIAVEGKVSEPFGPLVREWLAKKPSPVEGQPDIPSSAGKRERLAFLCSQLGVAPRDVGEIRYQLLHRTVSALLEADLFRTRHAVMLVHSFSRTGEWFDDYERFAATLGATAKRDELVQARVPGEGALYLGWVSGELEYLKA